MQRVNKHLNWFSNCDAKFDKQFKYAEKKQIPYVVIIGAKELETGSCNVKNLQTGVQETVLFADLPGKFS
jgi:histidyl-tRNA synthetase